MKTNPPYGHRKSQKLTTSHEGYGILLKGFAPGLSFPLQQRRRSMSRKDMDSREDTDSCW